MTIFPPKNTNVKEEER